MEKSQRLEALLSKLRNNNGERSFEMLYNLLVTEIQLESAIEPDFRKNDYLNNLRQTQEKQAKSYENIKKRRPKSNNFTEFNSFVDNFKQDISSELIRIKALK